MYHQWELYQVFPHLHSSDLHLFSLWEWFCWLVLKPAPYLYRLIHHGSISHLNTFCISHLQLIMQQSPNLRCLQKQLLPSSHSFPSQLCSFAQVLLILEPTLRKHLLSWACWSHGSGRSILLRLLLILFLIILHWAN